jgi:nitrite reductase (NO-forming)
MDRTRRLLVAIMLVSVATAACSAAAQPSWTWAPDGGTGTGPPRTEQPGTPQPTDAPAGSTGPAGGEMSPDPNAATTAATYYPRDPKAPARLAGTTHDIDLVIEERHMTVAEGFVREVWTFGGTVPGPVIRVQVGDTIRIHLDNHPPKALPLIALMHPPVNNLPHSVDFHASRVAPNDEMTSIKPGEKKVYEFKAEYAGVWMYHCQTEPLLQHIANGMYGMVIVEPKGGLDEVDQEFFFVQGEWYLGAQHQPASLAKAASAAPAPDFVVFNGIADQYQDHPIQVETGKRVRVFILDAGPNIDTSFHIEGTVFDRVIKEGIELKVGNEGSWGSQAVDLSPSQGAIVEFTMAEDGLYPIVTHAFNLVGRGALGLFQAGDGDPLK